MTGETMNSTPSERVLAFLAKLEELHPGTEIAAGLAGTGTALRVDDLYAILGEQARRESIAEVAVEVYQPNKLIQFEEFWQRYPRKVGKKAAYTAWEKLTVEQRQLAVDVIDDHTRMWVAEGRGTRTIPHASTWLNGWRFDDEIQYAPERNISPPPDNRHTRSGAVLDKMEQS